MVFPKEFLQKERADKISPIPCIGWLHTDSAVLVASSYT